MLSKVIWKSINDFLLHFIKTIEAFLNIIYLGGILANGKDSYLGSDWNRFPSLFNR